MSSEKKPIAPQAESQIIGFRLPKKLAREVKAEAVDRGLSLNRLFLEMWELYQQARKKK